MRAILYIATVGTWLILTVTAVRAHHAFSAEFDADKPVTLVGIVSKVELVNPHAWLHIDVTEPDGKVETWAIEVGSPNVMLRRGFNRTMLPIGAARSIRSNSVHVKGYQARDGSPKANGGTVTLSDGRTGGKCTDGRRGCC